VEKNNGMLSEKRTGEDVEGRDCGVNEGTVSAFTVKIYIYIYIYIL